VRRPNAPRRLRAGAVDRRTAAGAFAIAAVALFGTAAVAREPRAPAPVPDARAARELVTLMRTGERGSWLVTYDFTRTLAGGRSLHETMREGRSAGLHALVSGSSMTFERGTHEYQCNVVGTRSECTESATGTFLPAWAVLRVAVRVGAYGVAREPGETIAGDRASCFRVATTGSGYLSDLGTESEVCLARDGISLRQRIVRSSGDVDERVARSVRRRAGTGAVEALIRGF
jgi:hypothetical protein